MPFPVSGTINYIHTLQIVDYWKHKEWHVSKCLEMPQYAGEQQQQKSAQKSSHFKLQKMLMHVIDYLPYLLQKRLDSSAENKRLNITLRRISY